MPSKDADRICESSLKKETLVTLIDLVSLERVSLNERTQCPEARFQTETIPKADPATSKVPCRLNARHVTLLSMEISADSPVEFGLSLSRPSKSHVSTNPSAVPTTIDRPSGENWAHSTKVSFEYLIVLTRAEGMRPAGSRLGVFLVSLLSKS